MSLLDTFNFQKYSFFLPFQCIRNPEQQREGMADEVKITSEVEGQQHREEHYKEEVQDNLKEAVASEKKKVGKDKSKQKVNFPIRSLFVMISNFPGGRDSEESCKS